MIDQMHKIGWSTQIPKVHVSKFVSSFQATDVKVHEVDFNPDFIARIIPKLDWAEVCRAAETLNQLPPDLTPTLKENYESDEEFLKKAHHVLLEVEVINGELVCPETGRKFPISDGIPNMLLNEDEV